MNQLILGGVRSGKSMLAQQLAQEQWKQTPPDRRGTLWYAATMTPCDEEDRARIQKHLEARDGWGFQTLEVPFGFPDSLILKREDVILLDSVTLLLCNHLYGGGHPEQISSHLKKISEQVRGMVMVSDDTFSDAVLYPSETEQYRRLLGKLHQQLAEWSDIVIECQYGMQTIWKGT